MFQPGVDPALPQALPEAPFAAGGGGARRRVSALQGGCTLIRVAMLSHTTTTSHIIASIT